MPEHRIIYSAGVQQRSEPHARMPHPLLGVVQLLVTIGVVIGLSYGFFFVWQLTAPREVVVPRVQGLDEAAAKLMLHNSGLEAEIATRKASDTIPEGKVIEASPQPDRRVKQGRRVSLVISAGSAWTNAPDIKEMSERRAQSVLSEKFLVLGERRYIYHSRLPRGFVVDQLPPAGTRLLRNSEVKVLVSQGPRPASRPAPRVEAKPPAPPAPTPPPAEPLEPQAESGY